MLDVLYNTFGSAQEILERIAYAQNHSSNYLRLWNFQSLSIGIIHFDLRYFGSRFQFNLNLKSTFCKQTV